MAVIDAHLHLFPDEASGLLAQGGERLAGHAGVVDEVRAIGAQAGIDRVLACTTAIGAVLRDFGQDEDQIWSQFEEQNQWICELAEGDNLLWPALAADPTVDPARIEAHLRDYVARYDIRAIKIHPAIAHVMPGDRGFIGIYRLAAEAGLPVVSHGGSSEGAFYASDVQYCAPVNFAPVLQQFPELRLVVAHLGQPFYDDLLALGAEHRNAWTDLSFVLGARLIPPDRIAEVIRAYGVERVLFGTDFPYFDPADSLNALEDAGLSPAAFEMVTAGNATRLFIGD